MMNQRLCMAVNSIGGTTDEQMELFKRVGFDGYAIDWEDDDMVRVKAVGDRLGMTFEYIHAPLDPITRMWRGGKEADEGLSVVLKCLEDAAAVEVPIVVCHAIGGKPELVKEREGLDRYGRIVERSKELGVRIAIENTEGEAHLAAVMKEFWEDSWVGFCWDTGHELCHNSGKDMMALYGDKIICTHINDNLGVKDFYGNTDWTDDCHLLPFDGISDWESVVDRLNKYGYDRPLCFELSRSNKPNRHESDIYNMLSLEDYVMEAYKRACRVGALKMRRAKRG
ncbi:MAG: sugar phosphate isomerase/epimerase [Clostridia bacterium]|nr:sugar phosphate isomerase/epimerase [Clostridia bacterium]